MQDAAALVFEAMDDAPGTAHVDDVVAATHDGMDSSDGHEDDQDEYIEDENEDDDEEVALMQHGRPPGHPVTTPAMPFSRFHMMLIDDICEPLREHYAQALLTKLQSEWTRMATEDATLLQALFTAHLPSPLPTSDRESLYLECEWVTKWWNIVTNSGCVALDRESVQAHGLAHESATSSAGPTACPTSTPRPALTNESCQAASKRRRAHDVADRQEMQVLITATTACDQQGAKLPAIAVRNGEPVTLTMMATFRRQPPPVPVEPGCGHDATIANMDDGLNEEHSTIDLVRDVSTTALEAPIAPTDITATVDTEQLEPDVNIEHDTVLSDHVQAHQTPIVEEPLASSPLSRCDST